MPSADAPRRFSAMKSLFQNQNKDPNSKARRRAVKKEKTRLNPLDPEDPAYVQVEELFDAGWLHPHKPKPYVHSVFEIRSSEAMMEPFHKHLNAVQDAVGPWNADSVQRLLFHGTARMCALGETSDSVRLCGSSKCSMCSITRASFDIAKCGSRHHFSRFGAGIYSTSCSSKADDYASNVQEDLQLRALIVSSVVVGKAYKVTKTSTKMVCPPHGNHSVVGIPGEDLNYEETVVYLNEAIRPMYLITYGDLPEPRKRTMRGTLKTLFNTPIVS